MSSNGDASEPGTGRSGSSPLLVAGLALVFVVVGLSVYAPAFEGPFVSDDVNYIPENPWVTDPSGENLLAILDPRGAPAVVVHNYAPVHLLLHALEWRLFGLDVRGYHVVNVLVHALVSLLFFGVLRRATLPVWAAAVGAGVFLLHPANVEAVAWISQLKTLASLALSLAALLLHPRRPALALVCFVLALLAKATAAFALPVLALWMWAASAGEADASDRPDPRWRWLAAWAVALGVFALLEMPRFLHSGQASQPLHPELAVHVRTVFAIALRYLVMAVSSWGVAAFHDPPRALTWTHPWWLASLPVLGLLGWRLVHALRARRVEAAFWAWALISFAPISQVFPFLIPMGDRYLYFILPGLIGGSFLALRDLHGRLPEAARPWALRAAGAAGLGLVVAFGAVSHDRARIWRADTLLLVDSARRYPEGVSARLLEARRAISRGRPAEVVEALRAAFDGGYTRFEQLLQNPAYRNMLAFVEYQELVRDMASWWVERIEGYERPNQLELLYLAQAYGALGDGDAVIRTLERALAAGGPLDARIQAELSGWKQISPPPAGVEGSPG